jgi:hypothetical protein
MAYALLVEKALCDAVEAELLKIDGTVDAWRFDLRGHLHDYFVKSPDQVDVEQSPWVVVLPGDWTSAPGMSRTREGTSEVLVGVVIRPDPVRYPDPDTGKAKTVKTLALEFSGELRKALGNIPTVSAGGVGCNRQGEIAVELIVDPMGRFATFGASIPFKTHGSFGA